MTSFDLLRLIGEARDEYIMEARKKPRRKPVWMKALAAVLAVVLLGSGSVYLLAGGFGGMGASAPAESAAAMEEAIPEAAPESPMEDAPLAPEAAEPEAMGTAEVTLLAMPEYPEQIAYDDYDGRSDRWTENQISDNMSAALNRFSYQVSAAVLSSTEESSCFSPLSLYHTLSILASGAEGQTLEELLQLLGQSNLETLSEEIGKLYRLNNHDDEVNILKIANSLWLDKQEVAYDPDWVITAANDYYAEVYEADFSDPATGTALGNWIAEKTGGFLQPDGQEMGIEDDMVMTILNTLWYKTQWSDRFYEENNTEEDFTLRSGEKLQTTFMNMTEKEHQAIVTEEYTKSYRRLDGGARMIFVLPAEGVDVMSLLTEEKLTEIFENGSYTDADVVWSVPKFETNVNYDLSETLKTLGVTTAFDPGAADFSTMTEETPLFLSAIRQGTRISVEEKGIEAASWTMAGMEAGAPNEEPLPVVEMNLNRPFIYLITAQDGSNLFLGVVQNPDY